MSLIPIKLTKYPLKFATTGRFFKVISASDSIDVRFEYNNDSTFETTLYQGLGLDLPKQFDAFWLSSTTDQDVVVFASDAKLIDDRLETSLTGSATLESGKVTLIANEISPIVPSRLARRSVLISCDVDTYIGGSNLTIDNGIFIPAGDSIDIDTQAAIYGVSVTGGEIRTLSEVN